MKKDITYIQAVSRLNEIMQQMESGTLDVDALTDTLKEARELLAFCKEKLHTVDQSIKEITDSASPQSVE
jgi:exodeoxyribonuclease VII small subunit